MAYPLFSPISHPDQTMEREQTPQLRVSQFNDGYEQVATYGINSNMETINPKWTNANNTEATYIINFLDGRKGQPFLYQPNGQGAVKAYRCEKFTKVQKKGNYWELTAQFKQTAAV